MSHNGAFNLGVGYFFVPAFLFAGKWTLFTCICRMRRANFEFIQKAEAENLVLKELTGVNKFNTCTIVDVGLRVRIKRLRAGRVPMASVLKGFLLVPVK